MRRRVLATISFLSLLLFITTCVLVAFSWKTRLWLQGDWRGAETIRDGELPLTQAVELGFERGCVQVRYQATRGVGSVDPTTHRVGPVDREPLSLSLHAEARDSGPSPSPFWGWHFPKMYRSYVGGGTYSRSRFCYGPAWVLLAVFSVLPVWRWVRPLGRRSKKQQLVCPHCSYDLTGNSSGICPECGAACKAADPAGVSPAAGN